MVRNRRRLLFAAGGSAALGACTFTLEHGLFNPCRAELPRALAEDETVVAAWDGIDAARMWDCHAHLIGTGGSGSGVWVNPAMLNLANPVLYAQRLLYLNAGCAHDAQGSMDESYVERMLNLLEGMRPGVKLVLFAFDRNYAETGMPVPGETAFHVPDAYARATARRHPGRFEWAASVHTYRSDCLAALRDAKAQGARAVKWLPAAMGMDPASPRCDPFYAELVRLDLPLITHGGMERAVRVGERQHLGNPLRLRRALEHGVRVVVAHCATLGEDRDLDARRHREPGRAGARRGPRSQPPAVRFRAQAPPARGRQGLSTQRVRDAVVLRPAPVPRRESMTLFLVGSPPPMVCFAPEFASSSRPGA